MAIKSEIEYQVAVSKNISEGKIQWSRYNAMLVVNTIFIALIGFTYENGAPTFLRLILSVLGVLLCILWGSMTARGFMWTHFWAETARKIESGFSSKKSIKPFVSGLEKKEDKDTFFNTENSSYIIITIFIFIYSIIFLLDFFIFCRVCQNQY